MNNNNNSEYLRIEIPDEAKEFISAMQYSPRAKVLEITCLKKYDLKKFQFFVTSSNIQKTIKDLRKKIKQKIVNMTDEDIISIERIILDNLGIIDDKVVEEHSDINNEKIENRPEISFEEWQETLQEKYEILKENTFKNFPDVWQAIEFTLSIKNILHIKGNTLPFAGIILGQPSSSKTLALEMLRKLKIAYYTDSFTARSFVSHNTAVKQEQLAQIDMLPRLKDRLFLTPELSPLFSSKDEELQSNLGIITRILDGHGYESNSGAYGKRGYSENIMFTWVGASVEIPYKVYKILGNLGPKLYFFRMSVKRKTEDQYVDDLMYGNFTESQKEVTDSLMDYLKWFDCCPVGEFESDLIKIEHDHTKDDKKSLKHIVRLAIMLSHLRGVVKTRETKDSQGIDYSYLFPIIEHPSRATTMLKNLALGHCLIDGRNRITEYDIPIVIKTVLSTAPIERVLIFDLLLEKKGSLTTSEIMDFLNASRPTALRTMTELKALKLVTLEIENEDFDNSPKAIKLKDEFKWFLSEEFKNLRNGFVPEKFEEVCKEKSPPPTLKKYDNGEDFDFDYLKNIALEEFKQIETKEVKDENGYLLVSYVKLKENILSNPISYSLKVSEEVVDKVIDRMTDEGEIAKIREGYYYRNPTNDNTTDVSAAV